MKKILALFFLTVVGYSSASAQKLSTTDSLIVEIALLDMVIEEVAFEAPEELPPVTGRETFTEASLKDELYQKKQFLARFIREHKRDEGYIDFK